MTIFQIWVEPILLLGRALLSGMFKVVLNEPPFRDQLYMLKPNELGFNEQTRLTFPVHMENKREMETMKQCLSG